MDCIVYDNVVILLIIVGVSGDDICCCVLVVLDKVGLLDKVKNFFIQFFGGEQQCVGIVCVVVNKLVVLLVDELIGNFDEVFLEGILCLFEEFNCVGVMVLMVMYDLGFIFSCLYCVLMFSDGYLYGGIWGE